MSWLVGKALEIEGHGRATVVGFKKAASVMSNSKHTVRFAGGRETDLVLRRPKAGVSIGVKYTILDMSQLLDETLTKGDIWELLHDAAMKGENPSVEAVRATVAENPGAAARA